MTGFQTQVNAQPAIAVEGDFGSQNPRASVYAPAGGFVSSALQEAIVGHFAWLAADGLSVSSRGQSAVKPTGFVHREQQALITQYLGESSMIVRKGFPVTLFNAGDYFAINYGSASTIGGAVYAGYADGKAYANAAPAGTTGTGSIGSTNTAALGATFTASAGADATQLVVTAVTGVISVGDTVAGTGILGGTKVLSQVSGTTGGAGTYQLSAANTASAATVTAFGPTVVVSATTGLISIGDTISGGAGFPTGATVTAQVSGTAGGAGTYTISKPGTAYTASATGVTTFGNVLNLTAVTGTVPLGDAITGTGVPAGAVLLTQTSGAVGGIGVYTLSAPATAYAASTTVTFTGGILTSFVSKNVAQTGELMLISTWGN